MSLDAELPSQRGETWIDTKAIDRHRQLTASQRVARAMEISRAALAIAASARRSNATAFAPELIVDALNAGDVDYVIVGGLALAARGVVRATDDVDLVPEPSRENLDRLMAVLARLGASVDAAPADPSRRSLRTCHGYVHGSTKWRRRRGMPT